MKRTLATAILAITFVSCSSLALRSQDIIATSPSRIFRQEHPRLPYKAISTPFVVREINGTTYSKDGKPLEGAYVEIGLEDGRTYATVTSRNGGFEVRRIRFIGPFVRSATLRPGTYRFKVTKDGFHSQAGTIVVSPRAPKESVINIELVPGEGYEEEPRTAANELLLPATEAITPPHVPKHKKWPQKYSAVYVPVSLASGRVRTQEFPVENKWYNIIIQVEKPFPFRQMVCMLGASSGPLDERDCGSDERLLRADWTVWDNGRIVQWGSIPDRSGCIFTDENIFMCAGSFAGEAGKKYVVQLHFTKDGTPLNIANPRLIVIKHGKMFTRAEE